MREFFKFVIRFFHGWRRKMGAVTLWMALGVMAGWIRSVSHSDGYLIPGDDPTFHLVYSAPNRIGWVFVKNENGSVPRHYRTGERHRDVHPAIPVSDRPYVLIYGPVEPTHELAEAFERGPHWYLPYWALVAPLTAISAWLILSKPRPAKFREPPITTAN